MGAWFCQPRKRVNVSSWVGNENENPFEVSFSKKERICIRETYLVSEITKTLQSVHNS